MITLVIGFVTSVLLWLFFKPPFGKNIVHLNTNQRIAALTYDDGPNPPDTDRLLDLLAKHDVKATFFLIRSNRPNHHHTQTRRLPVCSAIRCH